uniref:Uncharacterized protein n=1 Tax=Anopheles stephensi TaxID=30069 RepID=A0A182YLI7_ANOST
MNNNYDDYEDDADRARGDDDDDDDEVVLVVAAAAAAAAVTAWLKKNHSLLLLLNNNLRININDKLPLNHAYTDNTYNCNNLKRQHSSSSTAGSSAAETVNPIVATCSPRAVGDGRAELLDGSGYNFTSLKPSPSLSLFSAVTNLFYHHRKAFRRKNGTGRQTTSTTTTTIMDEDFATIGQLGQTIATVIVALESIIFVVVALSSMIATATVVELVQFRTNPMASLRS